MAEGFKPVGINAGKYYNSDPTSRISKYENFPRPNENYYKWKERERNGRTTFIFVLVVSVLEIIGLWEIFIC